jgi:2-keto-4-pentenoate hydratase/2-oxohepta-3-ene-1,7-dioic acid hydratase in catechol pathway
VRRSKPSSRKRSAAYGTRQQDLALLPGDLIACGTSVGVGVMKEPVNTVTVAIVGIGELTNEFRQ